MANEIIDATHQPQQQQRQQQSQTGGRGEAGGRGKVWVVVLVVCLACSAAAAGVDVAGGLQLFLATTHAQHDERSLQRSRRRLNS